MQRLPKLRGGIVPLAALSRRHIDALYAYYNDTDIIGAVRVRQPDGHVVWTIDPTYIVQAASNYGPVAPVDPDTGAITIDKLPCYWWNAKNGVMECTMRSSDARGTSPAGSLTTPADGKYKAVYVLLDIADEDAVSWRLDASADCDSVQLACEAVASACDDDSRTWLIGVIDSAGVWSIGPERVGVRCGRES